MNSNASLELNYVVQPYSYNKMYLSNDYKTIYREQDEQINRMNEENPYTTG